METIKNCLGLSLFFLILHLSPASATVNQCTASDSCVVDCGYKGLGPEAPELEDLVPDTCRGIYVNELLLNSNAIKSIPASWMDGWRMKTLNLVSNSVSQISAGAFSGTDCTLERIFLSGNIGLGYYGLRKDMFSGVECSLKRLNLDGCRLKTGDLSALEDLKFLDQLHLNRNSITHLPEGVFKKMKNLVKLFLNENGITIPHYEQPFSGLQSLSKLELAHNRLQTVSSCSFSDLPVLNFLEFDGDALVCNCSLWWLKSTSWADSVSTCLQSLSNSETGACAEQDTSCSLVIPPNNDDGQQNEGSGNPTHTTALSTGELAAVLSVVVLIAIIAAVVVIVVVVLRRKGVATPKPGNTRVPYNSSNSFNAYDHTGDVVQETQLDIPALIKDTQSRPLPRAPSADAQGSPGEGIPSRESREGSHTYDMPISPSTLKEKPLVPEHAYLRLLSAPHSLGDGYVPMDGHGNGSLVKY